MTTIILRRLLRLLPLWRILLPLSIPRVRVRLDTSTHSHKKRRSQPFLLQILLRLLRRRRRVWSGILYRLRHILRRRRPNWTRIRRCRPSLMHWLLRLRGVTKIPFLRPNALFYVQPTVCGDCNLRRRKTYGRQKIVAPGGFIGVHPERFEGGGGVELFSHMRPAGSWRQTDVEAIAL